MTALSVVQATAWYAPHSVGGTEIFVEGLVSGLEARGVHSRVITPRPTGASASWTHNGAEVTTWPAVADVGEVGSLAAFRALLEATQPAIFHQHSWTPDCGANQLRIARELGLKTVLTVHVPSYTCMRGSMMRFGKRACDGKVRRRACAACWAEGRGAPRALAEAVALLPPLPVRAAGRLGTALSASRLAAERQDDVVEMVANSDRMVAVCRWLYDALARNGAGPDKLVLSRQGVGAPFLQQISSLAPAPRKVGPLRLLYLGRWHPVKGIDLVVRALQALPGAPIELVIHGVGDGPEERAYKAAIIALSKGDNRIRVADPLTRNAIPAAMQAYDAMVIPSVWFETGPLVALEAQAAGLFVLCSDLGGVAELIDDPAKGRRVKAGDIAAWAAAISDLASNPPKGRRWPVRTMDACVEDMARLYAELT